MKNFKIPLPNLELSRSIILGLIGLALIFGLMFYQLVSLTPGLSSREIDVYNTSKSSSDITSNMVNAPHKSAIYISTKLFEPEFGLRLVGALIGIVVIVLFYLLISHLYGTYISVATTAMFASSSLLLGMTRTATPVVMLLSLLSIVAVGAYIRFGKRPELGWLVGAFVVGLSAYTPGILLFLIPAAIWQYKYIKSSLKKLDRTMLIASSTILAVLLIPLLFSIFTQPSLIMQYLGLSKQIESVVIMAKYSYVAIVSIFVMSPVDSAYWLGRQPILDIFASVMFVCGVYNLIRKYKLDRLWLILGVTLLGIAWIGMTTNRYSIIVLLPFIYMVIGSGLSFITDRWFEIFPKNPIAKFIGASLIAIAVIISINFQLQRYFVAWANHQPTKEAFTEHLPNAR